MSKGGEHPLSRAGAAASNAAPIFPVEQTAGGVRPNDTPLFDLLEYLSDAQLRRAAQFYRDEVARLDQLLNRIHRLAAVTLGVGRVKTCGPSLPARGVLLARCQQTAWVMFDGADEPRSWPLDLLEAAE